MKRIDIKVSFRCNNNCLFCVQAHKKGLKDKSINSFKKALMDSANKYKSVVFTGGEPAIRKDIIELVQYAKSLGYKNIQIQSNGRMFSYVDLCRKIIQAGANEFCFSLHGPNHIVHDYLTNCNGSFYQTVSGIKNMLLLNQSVHVNTVIVKPNYRLLPKMICLYRSLGIKRCQLAFVHILGNAMLNYLSVVPKITLTIPYIKQALDDALSAKINIMTEAIPLCLLKGYEKCLAENYMPETKIYESNYIVPNFTLVRRNQAKTKGPNCPKCINYKECEGPWKEYPKLFGWKEFIPILN